MFGGPGALLLSSSSSPPLASSSSLPGFQNNVGPMLWFWSSKEPALARSSISPNISTPIPQCLAKSYSARQPYSKPSPSVSRFSPTWAPKIGLNVSRRSPVPSSTIGPNSISSASPPRGNLQKTPSQGPCFP